MGRLFCLIFVALWQSNYSNAEWNISGVVKCMQEPVPNMHVRLLTPKMWLWWNEASVVRTRVDGSFSLPDIPDAFTLKDIRAMVVRIDYQYDAGPHRKISIVDDVKSIKFEMYGLEPHIDNKSLLNENGKRHINLGVFPLLREECHALLVFTQVMVEYESETGLVHPQQQLFLVTNSLAGLQVDVPFATTDTIRIPRKYESISMDTARHEFGHTIRHSYDGSFLHLLLDIAKYTYMQSHWCGKKTNEGFAFNEGFAEFFSIYQCQLEVAYKNDFRYEDSVANSLVSLAHKCHAGGKSTGKTAFVQLLRDRPGKIHTFREFLQEHLSRYNCTID